VNKEKYKMTTIKTAFYLIAALILLNSGCNTYKNLTYIEGAAETPQDSTYSKIREQYMLQPHDLIYIRVFTGNEETDKFYNVMGGTGSNMGMTGSGGNLYLYSYHISDSGFIEMPVLGYLEVAGKSLVTVKEMVEHELKKYLNNAYVMVKFPSFKFTTLGEVNQVGVHNHQGEQLNILDALSMAGGITDYGKRQQVVIVRQTNKGTQSYVVDVTEDNIMASENYYIMPNDIIYVKPMKVKVFRIRSGDVLSFISAFTSIASVILLIITLNQSS
jgi:polysaccharide export outer membrane protein